MRRIHTYLPENVIERLQQQAIQQGVPRSELIRERLSAPQPRPAPPNVLGLTTDEFHKAVTEIRQRYSYGLDRQQAESVVACVVSILFNGSKND